MYNKTKKSIVKNSDNKSLRRLVIRPIDVDTEFRGTNDIIRTKIGQRVFVNVL